MLRGGGGGGVLGGGERGLVWEEMNITFPRAHLGACHQSLQIMEDVVDVPVPRDCRAVFRGTEDL